MRCTRLTRPPSGRALETSARRPRRTHPPARAAAALAGLAAPAAGLAATGWPTASKAAAEGTPLTGFLSQPTDQLAVPGMLAGAEITPEGDLYSGWAEYELRIGPRLEAWRTPTRTLPDPALPLLSSTMRVDGVRYVQTQYAIAVAGRPVAYETVTAVNPAGAQRR